MPLSAEAAAREVWAWRGVARPGGDAGGDGARGAEAHAERMWCESTADGSRRYIGPAEFAGALFFLGQGEKARTLLREVKEAKNGLRDTPVPTTGLLHVQLVAGSGWSAEARGAWRGRQGKAARSSQ